MHSSPQLVEPKELPDLPKPMFGFVENAEVINSRAAMIGIIAMFIVEAILGKGLLETVGISVGNGLGFEL